MKKNTEMEIYWLKKKLKIRQKEVGLDGGAEMR